MNRREFIAGAGAAIVARGASAAEGGSKPLRAVMPPGALSLSRFSRSCTACGLCISSCPEKALAHAGLLDYGLVGWMLPRLDFSKGACDPSCSRCAEVCPAKALARRKGEVVKVGLAEWSRENCRTTKGDTCTLCSERCPTDAITLVSDEEGQVAHPKVDASKCVGCGRCENYCPAERKAIKVAALDPQVKKI